MRDRTTLIDWLASLAVTVIDDGNDAATVAAALEAGSSQLPSDFAATTFSVCRVIGDSVQDIASFRMVTAEHGMPSTLVGAADILQAIMVSIAAAKLAWPSRRDARRARALLADVADRALVAAAALGADGAALYSWVAEFTGYAAQVISDAAANGVPMVKVRTGIALPSTVLAYHLYGKADRAGDLIETSRSATPMLMPVEFETLSA